MRTLSMADIDYAAGILGELIVRQGFNAFEDRNSVSSLPIPEEMKRPLYYSALHEKGELVGPALVFARTFDATTGSTELANAIECVCERCPVGDRWNAICLTSALAIAGGVDRQRVFGLISTLSLSAKDTNRLGAPLWGISGDELSGRAAKLMDGGNGMLARRCYLALGSKPLSSDGRSDVVSIYETRTKNLILLKIAAVACVLMEIFAIANGFAGGQAALAIAFVSVVASVGVFIAAVLKYVYQPFNRLNNILWTLFVIWAVGALPLAVMASVGGSGF